MDSVRRSLISLPIAVWFLFLVFCPFFLILLTSFFHRSELGEIQPAFELTAYRQLFDPLYLSVLIRTVVMAFCNAFFTISLAYPIAFYLSRLEKRKATWLLTFIMVPFWTNYLIRLLAFMDVLRLKPFGIQLTFTYPGILLALIYNYLPFAILPLYSTLAKIPQSLIEAALDLGAAKRRVLTKVLWPLSRRGVFSAALLVFIPSLGEFLIPELVGGGRNYFLGTFLQQQFLVVRNWPLGCAAIVFLILTSILLLWIVRPDLEAGA